MALGKLLAQKADDMNSLARNKSRIQPAPVRPVTLLLLVAVIGCTLLPGPFAVALAQSDYVLKLDTLGANPGTTIDYFVYLENAGEVGSFNLLVGYDASALWLQQVALSDTRAEDFESFDYILDEGGVPGRVRILGVADDGGLPVTAPLPAGDGAIIKLRFMVINDIQFSGMWLPLWFEFNDPLTQDDNTLTDGPGVKITQGEIDYYDGYVSVLDMGEVELGDINRNGFPYEVSDYVYFTNYFIYPGLYELDALQLANSDMNRDLIPASIADLVYLINIIISGVKQGAPNVDGEVSASVRVELAPGYAELRYSADFPVGGILASFHSSRPIDPRMVVNLQEHMKMELRVDGQRVRAFIYSDDGSAMPAGDNPFIGIADAVDLTLERIDLADAEGRTAKVFFASGSAIPSGFRLDQNYPNPFNPQTTIRFELTAAGAVRLAVYDVLGRMVAKLLDSDLSAGTHEVVFDGRGGDSASLASGVYFYRLTTEEGVLTRKMMLMK